MIKPWIIAMCVVFLLSGLTAQEPAWQPSAGHMQVPIWPGTPPGAQSRPDVETTETGNTLIAGRSAAPEVATTRTKDHFVAGKPWTYISNVSLPTMTVYSPQGKNTGVAMVVFPGGGYQILAIDLEGTEVCDWLTAKGITCVLLKYRVPNSGHHWDSKCKCYINPKPPAALQDAQRTVGWCDFTPRSGTLIRTRSACSDFPPEATWWRR